MRALASSAYVNISDTSINSSRVRLLDLLFLCRIRITGLLPEDAEYAPPVVDPLKGLDPLNKSGLGVDPLDKPGLRKFV